MASWRSICWCDPHRPSTRLSPPDRRGGAAWAALLLATATGGCHADIAATGTTPLPEARARQGTPLATDGSHPGMPAAAEALCRPAPSGFLRARLQGAIDAELDWSSPTTTQCIGGPRPSEDGLRLVFKGTAGADPLLVIIGVGIGEAVTAARNVPASVTVVREGAGEFFATQGDDKCAVDELSQDPIAGQLGRYRFTGRGYCVQPARAVGDGADAVLVSRFDVDAIVEYPREP
jgi:hypothetical protein